MCVLPSDDDFNAPAWFDGLDRHAALEKIRDIRYTDASGKTFLLFGTKKHS
jgi:hypothetical protein